MKNLKIKLNCFLGLVILLSCVPFFSALAEFDPGKIVEDKVFSDTKTFGGPEGIQKFLESKNSVLANTSPVFLSKLKEPQSVNLKQLLEDPRPNLGRLRTAAELIWDASRQSGINPQVILVTLNKEQGLITSANDYNPAKLQKALDRAMGFDCPDSSGCGNLFPGFYFQLFGNSDSEGNRYLGASKSLMKSFLTSGGRGPGVDSQGTIGGTVGKLRVSKVGDIINIYNETGPPYNAPEMSIVTLKNLATTALYRYTPHVYNGNYNFWKFFQAWFKYANGTIIALVGDVKNYIILDGSRRLLPDFVALARGMSVANKTVVSPNEISDYPESTPYGPNDNTIVKTASDSKKFVFIDSAKHPVSDFVLKQRGLNAEQYLLISDQENSLFETANQLPPKDGTVIRGKISPSIYLVDGGKIKLFSAFTYKQNKNPKAVLIDDSEVSLYPKAGFVTPLNGTLVKTSTNATVYFTENGLKRPLTSELFKNRGFAKSAIALLSADEVNALPEGDYVTPKDKTFFAVGTKTGPLYIFKEGAKHSISAFVAKQRGITPDYIFGQTESGSWADGIAIPPKDGTIIKTKEDSTVYLVVKGQLRPLSPLAFKNRKINAKKINILPQDEVEGYAKGEVLEK